MHILLLIYFIKKKEYFKNNQEKNIYLIKSYKFRSKNLINYILK